MPSRMPETAADKQATRMLTAGGAPHPTRQIQQGPSFCSSCGKAHHLGNGCSKSMTLAEAIEIVSKGVVRSANKRGNPYHDSETGQFTSSGAGGAGGGAPQAGPSESTMLSPAKAGPEGGTMKIGKPSSPSPDVGTAPTQEGPAPSSLGGGSAAGGTMAGKQSAKPDATVAGKVSAQASGGGESVSPSEIAEYERQQKENQGAVAAILRRQKEGGGQDEPERARGPFSHAGANAAYHQAKQEHLMSGGDDKAAHQAGMNAGQREYANAVRQLGGQQPMSQSQYAGATAPVRSAEGVLPGGGATTPSAKPPTMFGPSGTQVSGPPSGMPTPSSTQQGAAPGQPMSAPPVSGPGSSPPPVSGGKTKQGLIESLTKPWANYGTGASIGAGMFSPGGTVGATGAPVGQTAHSVLNYMKPAQQKPAAMQRQQQVQNAQNQSGHYNQQSTAYLNRLRGFLNMQQPPTGPAGRPQ